MKKYFSTSINWKLISSLNQDKLLNPRNKNLTTELLTNLICCDVTSELESDLKPSYLKLFLIFQQFLKYLKDSKNDLEGKIENIKNENMKEREEFLKVEKDVFSTMKNKIKNLEEELERKDETVKRLESSIDSFVKRNEEKKKETNFMCDYCCDWFEDEKKLKKHMRNEHSGFFSEESDDLKDEINYKSFNTTNSNKTYFLEKKKIKNPSVEMSILIKECQQLILKSDEIKKIIKNKKLNDSNNNSDCQANIEMDDLAEKQTNLLMKCSRLLDHASLTTKQTEESNKKDEEMKLKFLNDELFLLRKQNEGCGNLLEEVENKRVNEVAELNLKVQKQREEKMKMEEEIEERLKYVMESRQAQILQEIKSHQKAAYEEKLEKMKREFMEDINKLQLKQRETEANLEQYKNIKANIQTLGELEDGDPPTEEFKEKITDLISKSVSTCNLHKKQVKDEGCSTDPILTICVPTQTLSFHSGPPQFQGKFPDDLKKNQSCQTFPQFLINKDEIKKNNNINEKQNKKINQIIKEIKKEKKQRPRDVEKYLKKPMSDYKYYDGSPVSAEVVNELRKKIELNIQSRILSQDLNQPMRIPEKMLNEKLDIFKRRSIAQKTDIESVKRNLLDKINMDISNFNFSNNKNNNNYNNRNNKSKNNNNKKYNIKLKHKKNQIFGKKKKKFPVKEIKGHHRNEDKNIHGNDESSLTSVSPEQFSEFDDSN